MKTMKYFMGALLCCAVVFAACKKDDKNDPKKPDITPEASVPEPDDPEDGSRLLVIQFNGTICADGKIVLVGDYNGWVTDDPAALLEFKPYAEYEQAEEGDWDKWYYVIVPADVDKDSLPAKPVQLAADGTFSWDYQTGDAASWSIESGDAVVKGGYSGEADVTWVSKVCVAKSAGWKNGNYPCKEVSIEDFTVNVKCAGFVPCICGDFNTWGEHVAMTLVEGDQYTYTLAQQPEGKQFKITNGGWDAGVLLKSDYNTESNCYNKQGNYTLKAGENTIELEVVGLEGGELTVCE